MLDIEIFLAPRLYSSCKRQPLIVELECPFLFDVDARQYMSDLTASECLEKLETHSDLSPEGVDQQVAVDIKVGVLASALWANERVVVDEVVASNGNRVNCRRD